LRAARAWQVKPTEYLREWSTVDRTLAEALLYLEANTGDHGVPMWDATNPAKVFHVEQGLDLAAKAREEAIERLKDRKGSTAGVTFTVIDRGEPDDAHMEDA
jgi:hypothetical protein